MANNWARVASRLTGRNSAGDYYLSTLFVLRKVEQAPL
jgi:hypothetical protein